MGQHGRPSQSHFENSIGLCTHSSVVASDYSASGSEWESIPDQHTHTTVIEDKDKKGGLLTMDQQIRRLNPHEEQVEVQLHS